MTRRGWLVTLVLAWIAPAAHAQTGLQLWGNVTLDWVKNDRVTYELDVEPKALVAVPEGQPDWRNLDVTPNLTVAAANWLDLTGEVTTGFTHQNDQVNTFELTPRFGAEFHLLSRRLPTLVGRHERPPAFRLVLVNYFRVEWRHFFYSDDRADVSAWRFRNRLGVVFPLNREKHTQDGACYLLGDFEWFLPLSDPAERFSNRRRLRVGLGYRRSVHWRFEALYMWTRSRSTTEERFATTEKMIDIRVKHVF